MLTLQTGAFIFFSAGGYFRNRYIELTTLLTFKKKTLFMVVMTIYNLLTMPKWWLYITYLYYRSEGFVSGDKIIHKMILVWWVIILSFSWLLLFILLISKQVMIFHKLNFDVIENWESEFYIINLALRVVHVTSGVMLVSLDLYYQYRFLLYIKSCNSELSRTTSNEEMLIISKYCFATATFSILSIFCLAIRDSTDSINLEILFEFSSNLLTAMMLSILFVMRYKVDKVLDCRRNKV
jgi:hypothetical protein